MANIYDYAYDLENAIRSSQEYKQLEETFDKILADENSKKMFEDFRDLQSSFQLKQMQGEEITEEEMEKFQKQLEVIQLNPLIANLLEQEERVNVVMQDISKIVSKPLEEIYQKVSE